MSQRQDTTRAYALLAGFVAAAVIFTLWPGFDLWFSGLFYRPATGFYLAQNSVLRAFRELMYLATVLMPLLAAGAAGAAVVGWRVFAVPARLWLFILALFVTGPLILVNGVLKAHWGRARPADVVEFGGTADFTPALRIAHECASNCSFVSGEGAGGTALAVSLVLLIPFVLARASRRLRWQATGLALALTAAQVLLRVAMGRHFLSDAIIAVLLTLALALVLYRPIAGRGPRRDGRSKGC